jgi:hypothetical protein
MAFWALSLPLLKHLVSVRFLARLMWRSGRLAQRDFEDEARIVLLSHLVHPGRRKSKYNCLERSLIAYRFLSEVSADPRLVLGVRKLNGVVEGHAWVVVDGRPVRESAGSLRGFRPLVVFGIAGEPQKPTDFRA